jgi:hypothetical protein
MKTHSRLANSGFLWRRRELMSLWVTGEARHPLSLADIATAAHDCRAASTFDRRLYRDEFLEAAGQRPGAVRLNLLPVVIDQQDRKQEHAIIDRIPKCARCRISAGFFLKCDRPAYEKDVEHDRAVQIDHSAHPSEIRQDGNCGEQWCTTRCGDT